MPQANANLPASLKVSILTSVIVPRDAISNVTLQQADALARHARQHGIQMDLKIYAAASDVHDTRIAIAPDLAGVVTDEHFLASDLIIYQFGIVYPLFDTIHLAPAGAKIAVCYYGITSPSLLPEKYRDVLQQSYRQLTNVLAADQVLTTSAFLVDELMRVGVAPEIIARIPLSSCLCDGSPIPEKAPSDTIRLMYVGRFVQAKGVMDLLRAAIDLAKSGGFNFTLDLIGSQRFSDAAYLQRLEDLVREAKLQDSIRFCFDVSDQELRQRLRAVDALVIPSYHEGFSIPVIEAMASGCFVISSDAGALPETAGGLGSVYPAGDVDALKNRLELFFSAFRAGQMPADNGTLSFNEWRDSAQQYITAFSRNAFQENICNSLLGNLRTADGEARKNLAKARRALLIDFHQGPIQTPRNRSLELRITDVLNAARARGPERLEEPSSRPPANPPAAQSPVPAIPIDYVTALNDLWSKPDNQFVAGLYTLLLNRPAANEELAIHIPALQQGLPRAEMVRMFAESTEARDRGLDASWLPEFLQRSAQPAAPTAAKQTTESFGEIARRTIRGVPVIGPAARYAKRSFLLPWNFQRMFDTLPGQTALQAQTYGDQQSAFHLLMRLHGDILAEMRQANSSLRADLQHLKVRPAARRGTSGSTPASAQLDEIQTGLEGLREEVLEVINKTVGEATVSLSNWLNLLTRKEEMLAMDLRERIPPMPDRQFPDPMIVDPAAYQSKIASAAGQIKVNLGCGEKPLPDYINVDFRRVPEVDVIADVHKLPFAPASVAEIASSHLIEHFRQHHLATVILPYWKSLLMPNGLLRTICPNWLAMLQRVQAGKMSFADFKTVTFGLQDYSGDDHFSMYSPETLCQVLTDAGFHDIQILATARLNGICPEMEITARC
jgi:glycosyltransferase involved in cell wall biosynthesis/predicted SAM-dependent methyltransferase